MTALPMVLYAIATYVFFLATFVYAVFFTGGWLVPKTIDSGPAGPLAEALVVDVLLLGLFAVQHSVMARPAFKRWWTRIVPEPIERATYVLAASAALALLLWQWRPIAAPLVWRLDDPLAVALVHGVFWLGWAVLLISTFLLNHFELFGLQQVFVRKAGAGAVPELRTPLFYKHVRHPIYLGFVLAFWATPTMTAGHLLFAIATTGYILIGIWFEERDLVAHFGDRYRQYRDEVGMLVPWPKKSAARREVRAPLQ